MFDNLSAHKTKAVQQFLADHPIVRFHFTPTLLIVAQPSGVVVCQDPEGSPRTWHLHFRRRLGPEDSQVYSRIHQNRKALPLVLLRSPAQNLC